MKKSNKNANVVKCLIFTVLALVGLIANFLPVVTYSAWFVRSSLCPLDVFDMENLEELISWAGQDTSIFLCMKVMVVISVLMDLAGIIFIWLKNKAVPIISGIYKILFYVLAACMTANIASKSFVLENLRFTGIGWFNMVIGAAMIIIAITLSAGDKAEQKASRESDQQSNELLEGTGAIVGVTGEYVGARVPVGKEPLVIGRDASICHIIITGEKVSRKHCSIIYDPDTRQYVVVDHSTNGTFLNNEKMAKEIGTVASPDSLIKVGNDVFRLV